MVDAQCILAVFDDLAEFPAPIILHDCADFVRDVLPGPADDVFAFFVEDAVAVDGAGQCRPHGDDGDHVHVGKEQLSVFQDSHKASFLCAPTPSIADGVVNRRKRKNSHDQREMEVWNSRSV